MIFFHTFLKWFGKFPYRQLLNSSIAIIFFPRLDIYKKKNIKSKISFNMKNLTSFSRQKIIIVNIYIIF